VKLLRRELLGDPTHVARFLREVRASGALASPHVVRVLDVPEDDAPLPYLAMERLQGVDLAAWLREHGRMPVEEVVELVRQVSLGLDEARRAGIVHRDLKPQNLFRADEVGRTGPTWKVLDFGVSKLAGQSGTLTQGAVVGTPQYMAPEQASGQDVDHRADVYALAAIAFRCLTGRPPFVGASAPVILFQVVHDPAPRAASLAPVSSAVDDVLARGLAKRPGDRPPTATALAAALAEAAATATRPRRDRDRDATAT
jgi:serine/threonine-protein kinase